MKSILSTITSFRKFGDLQLVLFDNPFMDIKPGQFLLVYQPEKDDHLVPVYFTLELDGAYFSIFQHTSWEIGDQVYIRGPVGTGFKIPEYFSNLFCITLGQKYGSLYQIMDHATKKRKNVAYMCNSGNLLIPESVEVVFTDTINENLAWADMILIEMDNNEFRNNSKLLEKILNSGKPSEVLLYRPILCAGESECLICSVKTKTSYRKTCQNGSVYQLNELEFL